MVGGAGGGPCRFCAVFLFAQSGQSRSLLSLGTVRNGVGKNTDLTPMRQELGQHGQNGGSRPRPGQSSRLSHTGSTLAEWRARSTRPGQWGRYMGYLVWLLHSVLCPSSQGPLGKPGLTVIGAGRLAAAHLRGKIEIQSGPSPSSSPSFSFPHALKVPLKTPFDVRSHLESNLSTKSPLILGRKSFRATHLIPSSHLLGHHNNLLARRQPRKKGINSSNPFHHAQHLEVPIDYLFPLFRHRHNHPEHLAR